MDTIIIRLQKPGIYIMKMIATNNQGMKRESKNQYAVIKGKYDIIRKAHNKKTT